MDERSQKIREEVEKELSCSAHNIDHIMRVYNLALHLSKGMDIDMEVLEASVLLHDIARAREDADSTGKTDHAVLGSEMAYPILKDLGYDDEKIRHIQDCIISHRYRTGIRPKTMEAKILFDADKLDSLGAIGIARSFVWVGKNNAKIFTETDIEKYTEENLDGKKMGRIKDKTRHSPQIEFETKLRYIIDKLHTKKAKNIGKERLEYYKNFLERLRAEIKGRL